VRELPPRALPLCTTAYAALLRAARRHRAPHTVVRSIGCATTCATTSTLRTVVAPVHHHSTACATRGQRKQVPIFLRHTRTHTCVWAARGSMRMLRVAGQHAAVHVRIHSMDTHVSCGLPKPWSWVQVVRTSRARKLLHTQVAHTHSHI